MERFRSFQVVCACKRYSADIYNIGSPGELAGSVHTKGSSELHPARVAHLSHGLLVGERIDVGSSCINHHRVDRTARAIERRVGGTVRSGGRILQKSAGRAHRMLHRVGAVGAVHHPGSSCDPQAAQKKCRLVLRAHCICRRRRGRHSRSSGTPQHMRRRWLRMFESCAVTPLATPPSPAQLLSPFFPHSCRFPGSPVHFGTIQHVLHLSALKILAFRVLCSGLFLYRLLISINTLSRLI